MTRCDYCRETDGKHACNCWGPAAVDQPKQYTPSQATGLPQLSDEQLATVERAIRSHFGIVWKHWEVEAQVIWNALSATKPDAKDMQIAALMTKLKERDDKVRELRRAK
jgi:hypothetical protein